MGIKMKEYAQRRERLMKKIGAGTAIFRAATSTVMHNDVEYTFRQDSDFFYLTGFNEPEAVAVLTSHHEEHHFVLFVQPKDSEKEIWTGYRCGIEKAKEFYGADKVYSVDRLHEKLILYIEKADRIYYHLGRDKNFNEIILSHWQQLMAVYSKRGIGPIAIEDPNPILHSMRQVKSYTELERLRTAMDISVIAHNQAREFVKVGHYEYEIQAEIEHTFRSHGSMGPAYPSVVASGANACILHYTGNCRQIQENDLLLIDAGCSYGYYNGDITRTFPVNGKFTGEQRAIYELVLEAQLKAIESVKPGKPYNEFHDMAVCILVQGLIDLDLLKGNLEEIIQEEKYKPFYMHKTGHWLGLDVHDVGVYRYEEETWKVLEPGHLLTVEPGIYISPNIKSAEGQPEIPERWRGIGIRIEDDVLVTQMGNEVLTAGVPKMINEISS